MRRRAPDERVEPFRHRYHSTEAAPILEGLVEWCAERDAGPVDPELPEGIEDRAADCWEPLLLVADEAGSDWPARARAAAVHLTSRSVDESMTQGIELLTHISEAFAADGTLATVTLLERLLERDESPWNDIYGKPLNDRGLSKRLKPYGIKSKAIRFGQRVAKGYAAEDFHDTWKRYVPAFASGSGYKGYNGYIFDNKNNFVTDVTDVTDLAAPKAGACEACDGNLGKGCPTCKPEAYGLPPRVAAQ